MADQEILECFRANGWDKIISVLRGRIGLQALNSQCDACDHFAGSQGSARALCTAAVSADAYSVSSCSLQRDSGFCQINCCYLPSENSEAGHEALPFKAYGQEFPYILVDFH